MPELKLLLFLCLSTLFTISIKFTEFIEVRKVKQRELDNNQGWSWYAFRSYRNTGYAFTSPEKYKFNVCWRRIVR